MKRACEICHSELVEHLYTQDFVVPSSDSNFSYDVVACKKCGFVFAPNLPSQEEFEKFYKANLKYAYKHDDARLPDYVRYFHQLCFEMINAII